jgi:hypothetical protein
MSIQKFKLGIELRVGDTIQVWWSPDSEHSQRDTIISLTRCVGSGIVCGIKYTDLKIDRIAEFAHNKCGLTILGKATYIVYPKSCRVTARS